MDDTPAAEPLPVVFTEPGTSYVDTALAAVAMEKAAHALDWALRGDAAHDAPRWMHVTRADVLDAPDLEAALEAEGVSADAARTLARRIRPARRAHATSPRHPRRAVARHRGRGRRGRSANVPSCSPWHASPLPPPTHSPRPTHRAGSSSPRSSTP